MICMHTCVIVCDHRYKLKKMKAFLDECESSSKYAVSIMMDMKWLVAWW